MSKEIAKATKNAISTFASKAAVHLDTFISNLTTEKNAPFTLLTLATAGTVITCKALDKGYKVEAHKGNAQVTFTPPAK